MFEGKWMRRVVVGVMLSLGLAAVPAAMAQQPVTVVEEVPVNLSTPRGALKVLAAALQNGEGEKIRSVLTADTAVEQKMLTSMVDVASAVGELRKAAVAQFGEKGSLPLTGDAANTLKQGNKSLDLATEKVEDSKATVIMPNMPDDPIHMVKDNQGQWHMPMKELARGVVEADILKRAEEMALTVGVFKQVTLEINQGKFAGADEVRTVIQQRLASVLLGQPTPAAPTTAPVEAPTTAPAAAR